MTAHPVINSSFSAILGISHIQSAPASIEGTWWVTNDKVIVGIGLLSASERHFAIFNVIKSSVEDQTSQLLPLWNRMWDNADWFRAGKK